MESMDKWSVHFVVAVVAVVVVVVVVVGRRWILGIPIEMEMRNSNPE